VIVDKLDVVGAFGRPAEAKTVLVVDAGLSFECGRSHDGEQKQIPRSFRVQAGPSVTNYGRATYDLHDAVVSGICARSSISERLDREKLSVAASSQAESSWLALCNACQPHPNDLDGIERGEGR
jgi:hypothetical protein